MREGREEKRTPVGRALGKIKDRERKTGGGGGSATYEIARKEGK